MRVRDHIELIVRTIREFFEDQWFDLSRGVRTSGNVSLENSGISANRFQDSEWYMPARPAHIRQALHNMPVKDVSRFSYVDLGSGKGRTLFIAAELPFLQIIGVELSPVLHKQASSNISRFRFFKQRCTIIQSVQGNAVDFVFPNSDLVLYLFNPFGAETMDRVLTALEASLKTHPRHVVILLLWPRYSERVAAIERMHLHCETKQYQIFEARPE